MSSISSSGSAESDYSMLELAGTSSSGGSSSLQRRTMRTLENMERHGARDFVGRMQDLKEGIAELRRVIEESDLMGERSGAVGIASEAEIGLGAGDDAALLQDLGAFSSVVAGTFEVNGVSITVDPTTDTLNDVLGRIESSGADAQGSYSDSDHVTIRSHGFLEVSGDTTGLLAALQIQEGSDRNHGGTPAQIRAGARNITRAIENLQGPINGIYGEVTYESVALGNLVTARSAIQTSLEHAFGGADAESFETDWGFGLDVDEDDIEIGTKVIDMTPADVKNIRQTLLDTPTEVLEFLIGDGEQGGFLDGVENGLERALENLGEEMGYSGNVLSILV